MHKEKLETLHRLNTIYKSLKLLLLLLVITITLYVLDLKTLSKLTLYAIFPVFFWIYFHGAILILKNYKKFLDALNNRQTTLSDSLTDDKDNLPHIKLNDHNKDNH